MKFPIETPKNCESDLHNLRLIVIFVIQFKLNYGNTYKSSTYPVRGISG